ncbi:MAG: T9SS type A sorting domain-containing protein [Bacteroidota bacterium]
MSKAKFILIGLFFQTSLFFSQTTVIDSIFSGGIYRSYRVYIPAVYNGISARPLVFDLHGYTSNAANEQLYSNFKPISDTANFLMVYPQGTTLNGQPYWNAGISTTNVNDIQFISDLIDSLNVQYNIDASCIYSCGMSNGGYMSQTLACALNDRIAAIASVTGSMFTSQYSTCVPNRAVPVMQISGTADGTVLYTGSSGSLPIDTLVKYWVNNNNCNPVPAFTNVPNTNTSDGCTAEHYTYSGGTNNSSVELYKIIGGGHTWPGSPYVIGVTNQDFKASEKIWLFFRKYKLSHFNSIQEQENQSNINFYPNPCTDKITIQDPYFKGIIIVDMNGRVIIDSGQTQIDVSSLSKGIYSVIFISTNSYSVKKLVKI